MGRERSDTESANTLQADYYRGCLAAERSALVSVLAKQQKRLARYVAGGHELRANVVRARRRVRELQNEIDKVDWMIAALDLRFPAAAERQA